MAFSLPTSHYFFSIPLLFFKIDPQGNVTVYPIVVEHVPQTDDGPLLPRLVEKPIEVRAMA
jgi:hypothetical protein